MLKYQVLAKKIEKDIDSGVLLPGSPVPSVRQIVSIHKVSRPTVEKSLKILTQHGKLRHLPGLGYFVSERSAPEIGHLAFVTHLLASDTNLYVKGIANDINADTYTLSTFSSHADLEKYQKSIEQLSQLQPAGIIIHTLPHEVCDVDLTPLINSEIPIVALDVHMPELVCDRVFRSRQSAAENIARYIKESGLRDPAYISGGPRRTSKIMLADLREELDVYNIELPESRCFIFNLFRGYSDDDPNPYVDAEEQMTDLLKKGFSNRTLICGQDFLAIGALRAILKAGLKVPEDIAVISAKSCITNGIAPMKLTTVNAMFEQQGRMAAKLLMRRIGGYTGPPEVHHLAGNLIVGETT